jgi:hypothetical protein
VVGAAALGLLAYCGGLVWGAQFFPAPGAGPAEPRYVVLFVAATFLATMLHVGACVVAHRRPPRLFYVLFVAIAARMILLFGAPDPVLEGDPSRLRFDARMINQRLNPYEFRPAELIDIRPDEDLRIPGPKLERLRRARAAMSASNEAPRPEQVQRPDLVTTATPLSLWLGSIADRFKPGSTRGFAFVVLCGDFVAIYFLILALRALALPVAWVLVYAWSPVLLKEAYCTLAPEALMLPALGALVWAIAAGRRLLAAVPLAIAGALRFPLFLLAPVLARRIGIAGLLAAVALFVGTFLPFVGPEAPPERFVEGQVHVWRHYEYQSLLENLFRAGLSSRTGEAGNTLKVAGVDVVEPGQPIYPVLAKLLCLAVLLGTVVWLAFRGAVPTERNGTNPHADLTKLLVFFAVTLAVSPVVHPWHTLWLLPVLAVRPSGLSWLMLPALVSLGYLTHLTGPQAADLTLFGGAFSIRLATYGLFAVLLVVDLAWGHSVFPERAGARRRRDVSLDEPVQDFGHDFSFAEQALDRV